MWNIGCWGVISSMAHSLKAINHSDVEKECVLAFRVMSVPAFATAPGISLTASYNPIKKCPLRSPGLEKITLVSASARLFSTCLTGKSYLTGGLKTEHTHKWSHCCRLLFLKDHMFQKWVLVMTLMCTNTASCIMCCNKHKHLI